MGSGAEGAEGGFFFDYEDPLQPSKEEVFYLGHIWYEDPVKVRGAVDGGAVLF